MKMNRRTLLKGFKGLLLFLAAPIAACGKAIADSFPTRTVEKKDFRFDPSSGEVHWTAKDTKESYRLTIDGLVKEPVKLTYTQLKDLSRVSQTSDFHCVEGWTVPSVRWSGFRFSELSSRVKPDAEARYVTFHSMGTTRSRPRGRKHYVESFSLSDLLDHEQEILMTLFKDGNPLSQDRGAPLRVIAPSRLAYKSIKFVERVEFTNKPTKGWWTLASAAYTWEALVPRRRLRKPSRN
jgi:DMSO/TMAO reductase YedYZ molybdopterin-dependent catalytic subunit